MSELLSMSPPLDEKPTQPDKPLLGYIWNETMELTSAVEQELYAVVTLCAQVLSRGGGRSRKADRCSHSC